MLVDPSMEELLPNVTCAYELAVLVSKRANQLVNGGQPMVPDEAANMVSLACREVAQKKVVRVEGVLKKDEFSVPLTKEAREAIAAERKQREAQEAYKREAMQADVVAVEAAAAQEEAVDVVAEAVETFEVVEE